MAAGGCEGEMASCIVGGIEKPWLAAKQTAKAGASISGANQRQPVWHQRQ